MTKVKCAICNDKRAKRKCLISNDRFICPSCCAELRSDSCQECRHYQAAARYETFKTEVKAQKKFMIEVNEEVEDAVDRALLLVQKGNYKKARSMLRDLQIHHPRNHMVTVSYTHLTLPTN